jgi:hypothetical protein
VKIVRAAAAALALALALPWAVRPVAPTWSAFGQTTANSSSSFTAAASFYKAQILANGPVGYWRLGETAGSVAVGVTGASNGTYAGGVTPSAFPNTGLLNDTDGAIAFNATSGKITIPHVASFVLTNAASFEVWAKPNTVAGASERWVFNKGVNTFYLAIQSGQAVAGVTSTTVGIKQALTTLVTAGAWQHLVMTFNSTTLILYRNGVNVASVAVGGNIVATTAAINVGSKEGTMGWYDGRLDEVALYNIALTPAQILADYQRGALTR